MKLDLYQLLLIFWRRKILFSGVVLFTVALGVLYCLVAKPVYRSEAVIIPLKTEGLVIPQMLADFLSLPGTKSKVTVLSVLESRLLRERVIKRLNLLPVLFPKEWDLQSQTWRLKPGKSPPDLLEGAKKLKKLIKLEEDKRLGTVKIAVEFPKRPELAFHIAQAVIEETRLILQEKSFSLTKKSRLALERRLKGLRAKIAELEKIYRDFAAGHLKEVPLLIEESSLETVTKELPTKDEKALSKLAELRQKLSELNRPDYVAAPDYQLNLLKLKAQLNIAFSLYELLLKQYEITRAREMRETVAFQVIDPPFKPKKEKPYKPKKFLILAFSFIGGIGAGIFVVVALEWWESTRQTREKPTFKKEGG